MIKRAQLIFGNEFWHQVMFEFTFWEHTNYAIKIREFSGQDEEYKRKYWNEIFRREFDIDVSSFFKIK